MASLRQLAPPVRLVKRLICKHFNGVPYYGTITHVRTDTDGEQLYCVQYADNDYEEFTFHEVMKYLLAALRPC